MTRSTSQPFLSSSLLLLLLLLVVVVVEVLIVIIIIIIIIIIINANCIVFCSKTKLINHALESMRFALHLMEYEQDLYDITYNR